LTQFVFIPSIYRTQTVSAAKAEAEKIRLIGEAEAHALEAVGISEAERMRMKAVVYKKYGEAAILNITLNALPKVTMRYISALYFYYVLSYLVYCNIGRVRADS